MIDQQWMLTCLFDFEVLQKQENVTNGELVFLGFSQTSLENRVSIALSYSWGVETIYQDHNSCEIRHIMTSGSMIIESQM